MTLPQSTTCFALSLLLALAFAVTFPLVVGRSLEEFSALAFHKRATPPAESPAYWGCVSHVEMKAMQAESTWVPFFSNRWAVMLEGIKNNR